MAELFNPETASLEELRSRCEQGEVEPPTPAPVPPAPAAEPPELVTYRRRVENPDGTETVFEADSMSELVDLLVEAQRNSTIQIKKMSAQVPKPSTNSAQEEFQTAYEFQSAPSRTFARLRQTRQTIVLAIGHVELFALFTGPLRESTMAAGK